MSELIKANTAIEKDARDSLMGWLKKYQRSVEKVLPRTMNPERITWLIINNIRTTPALAGCKPESFINAVLLASNMGIEIRRNSAYLIPFGADCQLLIDYRAKIDLAARAGVTIYPPQLVYEKDLFEYGWDRTGLEFRHKPDLFGEDRGALRGVWSMAENQAERKIVQVMSIADIERVRRRSRAGCAAPFKHYGKDVPGLTFQEIMELEGKEIPRQYRQPWVTDYLRMMEKTVIHAIFNRIPSTAEMELSQRVDEAIETGTVVAAEQMDQLEFDPADNRPLVDGGGETREEQAQAQSAVLLEKLHDGVRSELNRMKAKLGSAESGFAIIAECAANQGSLVDDLRTPEEASKALKMLQAELAKKAK